MFAQVVPAPNPGVVNESPICRRQRQIYSTWGSGCSAPKCGLSQLFYTLLILGPWCEGPSRIVLMSFFLSCCVDAVLGVGILPGNSSTELFPASQVSLCRDLSDMSLSLGKSHVCSTSPLPPAPNMCCSHAQRLLFCMTDHLSSGGAAGAPQHVAIITSGVRAAAGSLPAVIASAPMQSRVRAPLAPGGHLSSILLFLSCPGLARSTSPLPCSQLTCLAANPCQAQKQHISCGGRIRVLLRRLSRS